MFVRNRAFALTSARVQTNALVRSRNPIKFLCILTKSILRSVEPAHVRTSTSTVCKSTVLVNYTYRSQAESIYYYSTAFDNTQLYSWYRFPKGSSKSSSSFQREIKQQTMMQTNNASHSSANTTLLMAQLLARIPRTDRRHGSLAEIARLAQPRSQHCQQGLNH